MSSTTSSEQITVCFVLGAPGTGKGTLCKQLARDFPVYHLSVGDYLRELSHEPAWMMASVSHAVKLSKPRLMDYLRERKLIPAEIIVPLLYEKIEREYDNGERDFLLDGFPRDKESAVLFDESIGLPANVILFECEPATAQARFLARAREHGDSAEMWQQRYDEFEENNSEIVQHYDDIVHKVDTNLASEITYPGLKQWFEETLEISEREADDPERDADDPEP